MVKQVFEYLAEKLAALQMFELVIPIAEIIDKMDGSFPAYYIGKGNYRPIDLSAYAGVGYFRKLSAAQFAKSDRETFVGSETLEEVTIPVRLVLSIKKDILNIDTGFASSYLFEEMIRVFSGNHPLLADKAGVSDVEVLMKDSEDDRLKIFAQEYTGSTLRELPYDWIMVMVDMDVKLTFNKNCINKFCDGYASDGCSPVITPTPTPCPDPEPCPELDPMTVTGVRCDFNATFNNDFPNDSYIYRIRYDGGEIFPADSFPSTIVDEGWWVSARNMLQAEGINFEPGVINVSDVGEGEYIVGIGQCDTKMLDITLKRHSTGAEILTAAFTQMYCAAYIPPCPDTDLGENQPVEYIPSTVLWSDLGDSWRHEGSSGDILTLHYTTLEEGWYLFEIDLDENTNGFHITGMITQDCLTPGMLKIAVYNTESDNDIQISPIDANAIVRFRKDSVRLRRITS